MGVKPLVEMVMAQDVTAPTWDRSALTAEELEESKALVRKMIDNT
jgi:hypothetical protein